jgi:hypothetical protein
MRSRILRSVRRWLRGCLRAIHGLNDSAYGKIPAGAGPGEKFSIDLRPVEGPGRRIEFGTERPTKITRMEE